jgi:hypothetical protein
LAFFPPSQGACQKGVFFPSSRVMSLGA